MSKSLRRAVYAGETEEGRALLARAPTLHIATTDSCGKPHILVVHPVVVADEGGDWLAFHGAPAGEKTNVLLDHPSVRNTRMLRLGTKDAMDFYRRFGFVDFAELQAKRPYVSTEMAFLRA